MAEIDHDKKLVLAKAKKHVEQKKKAEADARAGESLAGLDRFVSDLDSLLARGIDVKGFDNVELLAETVATFGQRVSELLNEIRTRTASLYELDIPDVIELKQITDENLLDALAKVGDNGELLSKIQSLDQTISVLRDAIKEIKAPRQGQRPEDYLPVRVVDDIKGKLGWLTQTQVPTFVGGGSTGLTDAELRASPVPVSASIDTTGLATEAKQDNIITELQTLNSLVPSVYDYIDLSYTGDNLTGVVFKTGGSGGTTVSTLTLAYSGSNLTSVTKT